VVAMDTVATVAVMVADLATVADTADIANRRSGNDEAPRKRGAFVCLLSTYLACDSSRAFT
jgi:hypothetical protein